jgi:hypothetical protein
MEQTMEILDKQSLSVAQYQPFYAQLAQLEKDNAALAFDYESKKGNKEARSHINTLRLTKGALERTRKSAKEESLRIGKAVDSEAKEIALRIETMIDVHQAKVDEIEQREVGRLAGLSARLGAILDIGSAADTSAATLEALAELQAVVIDDTWQEFVADAGKAKDAHQRTLAARLESLHKYEAEQAELERLRAQAEAREQQDRDAAIAKAGADKATADAAAHLAQEAAKAKQAIEAVELRAKQDREAAERRELELKLQAEQAERRRLDAERKAETDAADATARAEQSRLQSVQDEKDRVAAIAQEAALATARREKDTAHKAGVNRAALAALVAGGISEECAKACIRLIASGKIPAVHVSY